MRKSLLLAALVSLAWAAPAFAQVSDADREAARNLFKEGDALQQAGKYQDALDRFSKSNAVFQAPTTMLHMAECFAQLGKLVEAEETYRALERVALPHGSPPAFVAAQTQGAAELQQVEPRIPHVVLDVSPHPPGVTVTIDGQSMNAALLGVDRPIDPGSHTFVIEAPGYMRSEQAITFAEKEPAKRVVFQLRATGAPVVMPTPMPGQVQPQPTYVVQPMPYGVVPTYGFAPQQYQPSVIRDWDPSRPMPAGYHPEKRVRKGLVIGGAVTFASMYLFTVLGAVIASDATSLGGSSCSCGALYIPGVGPFAYMPQTSGATADFLLALDGVVQLGGIAMFIGGLAAPTTVLVRDTALDLKIEPIVAKDFQGTALVGHF